MHFCEQTAASEFDQGHSNFYTASCKPAGIASIILILQFKFSKELANINHSKWWRPLMTTIDDDHWWRPLMTTVDGGSRSSPLVDRNLRQLTIMRGPNHRRSTDTTASSRTTSDRIFSWIRFTRPVPKSFGSSENPHSGLAPDSEHQQQASPTKQVIPQHHRHGLHGLPLLRLLG